MWTSGKQPYSASRWAASARATPGADEAEDGGRAIAIEEGISALVISYAVRHRCLAGIKHIDQELLATVDHMTARLEVSICRAADGEHAILAGHTAWRQLREQNGATVHIDLGQRILTVTQD